MLYKVGYFFNEGGDALCIRYVFKSYDLSQCFDFVGQANSYEQLFVFDESDGIVTQHTVSQPKILVDCH